MVGPSLPTQTQEWLVMGRSLFLTIHVVGTLCFAYIVVKRLVPLIHAEHDLRFDHPLIRIAKVFKFWLGQWKHPRYKFAGTVHILIFTGFIILVIRTFAVMIGGINHSLEIPGLSDSLAHVYDIATDYAVTVVFLCMVVAAVRRLVFKPGRYAVPAKYGKAHAADAEFRIGLSAVLMTADSLIAATHS